MQSNQQTSDQEVIILSSDEETKLKDESTVRRRKSIDSKKSTDERNHVKAIKLQNATLKQCSTNATKSFKFKNSALPQNYKSYQTVHVNSHRSRTHSHLHTNNTSSNIQHTSKNSLNLPKNLISSNSSSQKKYSSGQGSHQFASSSNIVVHERKNEKTLMTKLDNLKKGGLSIENVKNLTKIRNTASEDCVMLNKSLPKVQGSNFKNYSTITSNPSKKILKATKKLGGFTNQNTETFSIGKKDSNKHSVQKKTNVPNTKSERENKLLTKTQSVKIINVPDDGRKLGNSTKLNAGLIKSKTNKIIKLDENSSLRICDIIEIEKTPLEEFSLFPNISISKTTQQKNDVKTIHNAVSDKQSNVKNSELNLETMPTLTKSDDSKNQHTANIDVKKIQNGLGVCSKLTTHTPKGDQKSSILNTISFDENVKECFNKSASKELKNSNEISERKQESDIALSTNCPKTESEEKNLSIQCDPTPDPKSNDSSKKFNTENGKINVVFPTLSSVLTLSATKSDDDKHSFKQANDDLISAAANPEIIKPLNSQKRLHEPENEGPTFPVRKRIKKDEKVEPIATDSHSKVTDEMNNVSLEKNLNNEEKFKNFLEFCKPLALKVGVTSEDWTQISANLISGYHAANPSYTMNSEFIHLISDTKKTIGNKHSSVLTELHTIAKELKAYKIRKPKKRKRLKSLESEHLKFNPSTSDVTEEMETNYKTDLNSERLKIFDGNGMHENTNDLAEVKPNKSNNGTIISVPTESSNSSLNQPLESCSKIDNVLPPTSDSSSDRLSSLDQVCKTSTNENSFHPSDSSKDSYFTSLYLVSKPSTSSALIEPLSSYSHNHESKSSEYKNYQHGSTITVTSSPSSDDEVREASNTNSHTPENVMLVNSTEFHRNKQKKEKYIRKLEKLLGQYDKRIKKLQQKELSLDDLDNDQSAYIIEEKLKKKVMIIWKILCKEKKRSTKVETERPIKPRGTRYLAVDKAIKKFVNKSKIFPDFGDIRDIVNKVHEETDLGLQSCEITELAREIFQNIGYALKHRRLKDFREFMGCSLTDVPEIKNDPADHDTDLQKVLEENAAIASKKLNEVFSDYALKQMTLKDEVDKSDSSDSNVEDNDNEQNEAELPETEAVMSSSDEEREALPMLVSTSVQPLHAVAASLKLNADQELNRFENDIIDILSNSDASTEPNSNSEAQDNIKILHLQEEGANKPSVPSSSALT